jgi:hypothetical protein
LEGALCILLTLVAERKVEILELSNCSGKIELFCTAFFQVVFVELCNSRVAILVPQKFQVPTFSKMLEMWRKKEMNAFGVIYSWFLAKVHVVHITVLLSYSNNFCDANIRM